MVSLKENASQPYIKLDVREEWPKKVTRGGYLNLIEARSQKLNSHTMRWGIVVSVGGAGGL